MSYMFYNCWCLSSFPDISKWKTGSVKNMSHMFHNCWSLQFFPKIDWNISNVNDLSHMFHNVSLDILDIKWNYSNFQNVHHMFTNFNNYHSFGPLINVIFSFPQSKKIISVYRD